MRSLLERDLDYFACDDISDILIDEEARRQGERRRRTDEADGFYKPLEDGED